MTADTMRFVAGIVGGSPPLNPFSSVYLSWHDVEKDCSNKSVPALRKYFHAVDCS